MRHILIVSCRRVRPAVAADLLVKEQMITVIAEAVDMLDAAWALAEEILDKSWDS